MSEKPICTLTILAPISNQYVEMLAETIRASCNDPDAAEALRLGESLEFEDQIDSEMNIELGRLLHANKTPYVWRWTAFGTSGAGMHLYDPAQGVFEFKLYEEQIVLPLVSAIDPTRVGRVLERMNWMNQAITKQMETMKAKEIA